MFWYFGPYQNSLQQEKPLAVNAIMDKQFNALAQIYIYENSHQVIFNNQNKPFFTELMSESQEVAKLDVKNGAFETKNFQPTENLYLSNDGYEVFCTSFNADEVRGIIMQKNTIRHIYPDNRLKVIQWIADGNEIIFVSLHSFPQEGLNLWTRTSYFLETEKTAASSHNQNSIQQ